MADIVNGSVDGQQASAEDAEDAAQEILQVARDRLNLAEEAEAEIRRAGVDDLQFRAGNQWPDNIQQDREREGRPCLTINRLPQFVQQVTNDQRINRPGIKVHPIGDGASEDTAKIIQGLIRHIEYNSSAEAAYDTAFEGAVQNGFGYWRIATEYSDPESFDLELVIKRIRDPFSVFLDPYRQEPDARDMAWGFITNDLSKEVYLEKYPDSQMASSGFDWIGVGNDQPSWFRNNGVRVAEYFYIEKKRELIHLLKTGVVVPDHELESHVSMAQQKNIDASPIRSRMAEIPVVHWLKINGIEILEESIWPGSYVPIIPVYGSEVYVNGKLILESLIRNAKDPQRMYNYWKSAETETIALAPRAPWVMADGQQEGYEEQWESANRRNHSVLIYKPTTIAGIPAPPPQRQNFEPATQAITQAAALAIDDLKATTGIYDPALGRESPEISGVAIQKRTTQSQISNFHFVDNLTRAQKHTGRILIEVIPAIYDTARSVRIVHEDGTQKIVRINQSFQDESGKEKIYQLDVGRYDVTIDTGPSFASKRQEAAAAMTEITRVYPQLMASCGDLMVKQMDWPLAQDISDRLKLLLPPQLQQDPAKAKQIPPIVQAQMQQMQQLVKQLTVELNETTKIIETKKLDLEHRERVEFAKIQADIEINLAKLGTQSSIALLEQEIGAINHRLKLIGIDQPIDAPSDFDPQKADGGNYAGFGHVGAPSSPTGGVTAESPGQPVENNGP